MSDCCECTYYNKKKMDGPAVWQPIQCQCCDGGSEFIERGKRPNPPTKAQIESLYRAALEDLSMLRANYGVMKAERDALAHFANGWDTSYSWDTDAKTFRCRGCQTAKRVGVACDHAPGCPVALAERIVKEAGDGR